MFSHRLYALVDFIPMTDQCHSDLFKITVFDASYLRQVFVARSLKISGILPHVDTAQPLGDRV